VTIKRETILETIKGLLEDIEEIDGRIYRSRTEAYARDEAPAISIEPAEDVASQTPVSNCWIDWTLSVDVSIYTRGQVPEQLAAPIVEQVHELIMTDRLLGGVSMDVWPTGVQHLREKADLTAGMTVLTFGVRYRTRVADLTQ
jgi:hypothetical protein